MRENAPDVKVIIGNGAIIDDMLKGKVAYELFTGVPAEFSTSDIDAQKENSGSDFDALLGLGEHGCALLHVAATGEVRDQRGASNDSRRLVSS